MTNSIVRDNTAPVGAQVDLNVDTGSAISVTYCNVEGGWTGTGNIDLDPGFVDPLGGDEIACTDDEDFRVLAGSPCIDASSNAAMPPDVTEDLDGNPRFVDDPATPDTGSGTPPIIDMGAYEFQGAALLPGIVAVVSVNGHAGVGDIAVPVDLDASVSVNSGDVTTESRLDGVTLLEINFADALDPAVGGLGNAAVDITPDPGVTISTSLAGGDMTLVLEFSPADGQTYAVTLTDSVTAAGAATPGDRDFELRALAGNVASESGAGPQTVNAIDLGLADGIRGKFSADVSDPTNAPFDVNQDGLINAVDYSCVRLTCGLFGNTAP